MPVLILLPIIGGRLAPDDYARVNGFAFDAVVDTKSSNHVPITHVTMGELLDTAIKAVGDKAAAQVILATSVEQYLH
ncbi:hypothetical protein F5X99DRAFT_413044 [Biscogniauxia marginata]|nr:hypothetical protein F5X99DRAFT_413044 [Biscogniauxia marginata]